MPDQWSRIWSFFFSFSKCFSACCLTWATRSLTYKCTRSFCMGMHTGDLSLQSCRKNFCRVCREFDSREVFGWVQSLAGNCHVSKWWPFSIMLLKIAAFKSQCSHSAKLTHLSLFLSGSTRTDFAPQMEKLNKEKYTVYAFDPRGYGRSIPPTRDWPLLFLQRDAEDAVTLMKVRLIGCCDFDKGETDWMLWLWWRWDWLDAVTLMKVRLIGSIKQAEKNKGNVLTETRWDTDTKQLSASAQNIFIHNKTTSKTVLVLVLLHLVILTSSPSLFS